MRLVTVMNRLVDRSHPAARREGRVRLDAELRAGEGGAEDGDGESEGREPLRPRPLHARAGRLHLATAQCAYQRRVGGPWRRARRSWVHWHCHGARAGEVRGVCDEIFDEYRCRGREGAGEVGGDVAPLPGWN